MYWEAWTFEISDKEFAYINSFITETVNSTGVGSYQLEHSGMNHLDGVQAVAYARLRLMDTDFNRTERQRKVLGQAMEKAKNSKFKTLRTLVGAVYPQISTSIGVDDVLALAKGAKKYYIGQTSGFPFSHQEMKIGKKSCVTQPPWRAMSYSCICSYTTRNSMTHRHP